MIEIFKQKLKKYIKPYSLAWWSGAVPIFCGFFILTESIHGYTSLTFIIQEQYRDMTAFAIINYGITVIGLRGKDG